MEFSLFENKYAGRRCFILGGAPSILDEDLSLLKDDIVFITNRGYLLTEMHNLSHYDFYVCTDGRVYDFNKLEIREKVSCPRFYSQPVTSTNHVEEDYVFLDKPRKDHFLGSYPFPKSFEDTWGATGSVVFEASVVAYFMGFEEVYLLGVDLDYSMENTHFYKMGPRETRYRHAIPNNIINIKKSMTKLTNQYNSEGRKYINLSNNFKFDEMEKGSLQELMAK